jgi:hypothetical protein
MYLYVKNFLVTTSGVLFLQKKRTKFYEGKDDLSVRLFSQVYLEFSVGPKGTRGLLNI